MLFYIVIACVAAFLLWRAFQWKIYNDTSVCFTGGIGSGKSFMTFVTARRAYKGQLRRWKKRRFLPGYEEPPLVYSSIPFQYKKGKWATKLTVEHLLLQKRIRPLSVVIIDEGDVFANQFQFHNPCIVNTKGGDQDGNYDEFCRLFRHYTKGGKLITNTQCLDNLNMTIRRRHNVEVNLSGIRVTDYGFFLYYKVMFRHRTGNIEVTEGKDDALDGYQIQRGIIFPAYKMYDTYCYSRRYERVPYGEEELFTEWKIDDPLMAPYGRQPKLTVKPPDAAPDTPPEPFTEGGVDVDAIFGD